MDSRTPKDSSYTVKVSNVLTMCGIAKTETFSHGEKLKRKTNLVPLSWETGLCLSINSERNGDSC